MPDAPGRAGPDDRPWVFGMNPVGRPACPRAGNRREIMNQRPTMPRRARSAVVHAVAAGVLSVPGVLRADTTPAAVLDPNLQVTTVLNTGISQPIGIVFL